MHAKMKPREVGDLLGKTLREIRVDRSLNEIHLFAESGEHFVMYHEEDCCESVTINDISGDTADLIGSPILKAEEVDSADVPPLSTDEDSYTWTFYHLATIKGYVTLRWYGCSNGYYSESVDFAEELPTPGYLPGYSS
jgi:hypothetical protein